MRFRVPIISLLQELYETDLDLAHDEDRSRLQEQFPSAFPVFFLCLACGSKASTRSCKKHR